MDTQKKAVLYLGIDPKHFKTNKNMIHMPLVRIVPRPVDSLEMRHIFSRIDLFTHIIFTSKSAVRIFFDYYRVLGHDLEELSQKYIIAIGQLAAYQLKEEGVHPSYIAADETIEGVIRLLASINLETSNVLLPRSSSTYPQLAHFLVEHNIRHQVCVLYDMYPQKPYDLPNLETVDEVVFTSPATVDAFFSLYEKVPSTIRFRPLGVWSREALRRKLSSETEELVHAEEAHG